MSAPAWPPRTPYASSVCATFLLVFAISAGPAPLRAQDIYKSVDSQGKVIYSDRPPPGDKSGEAVDEEQPLPGVLHFCWTNCFTLKAEHGVYARTDGTDEAWTVERFTLSSFVLRRHGAPAAWNGFHSDVTYAGRVANERLIDVTVDGRPVPDIQMSWGHALHTLPGSNAERDRLAAQGPGEPPADDGTPPSETDAPQVTTSEVPPPLPDDEEQPACAEVGGIWVPGYWGWTATSYHWVRGGWVRPPQVGWLWTPGYWVLEGTVYVFHPGYWGPRVGYYGGINYGYGYYGSGYSGGRWVGSKFLYNTAVSHVNTQVIHDTYREPARADDALSRVSYHVTPGSTTVIHLPKGHIESREPQPGAAPVLAKAPARGAPHSTAHAPAHRTASTHATVAASRTPPDTQSSSDTQSSDVSRPKHSKPDKLPTTQRGSAARLPTPNPEK
jgi:hypothetical protein